MAKKPKSNAGTGTNVRGVDLAEVERLLAFMHKHGLEEFEYARGGVHIRLKKPSTTPAAAQRSVRSGDTTPPASHDAATPSSPGARERAADGSRTPDAHIIKSPIVGTFYAAAGPDAEPFVSVGARVDQGQVLCIIEAMKLMNEIESDVAGEVVRIFVESGNPVEYGEALFAIRPAGKK